MANMVGKQFIFMFMTTLVFFLVVSTTTTHARYGKNFEFTKFAKAQQTQAFSNTPLDAKKFTRPNFYQQTSDHEDHPFGVFGPPTPPSPVNQNPTKYTTVQERYQTAYNPDAEKTNNDDNFYQATKEVEKEKPTHTTNPAQQQYHYQNYNGATKEEEEADVSNTAQKYQYQPYNYAYNNNGYTTKEESDDDKNKFQTYYQQQQQQQEETNPTAKQYNHAYETTTTNNKDATNEYYHQQQQQEHETKNTQNNDNVFKTDQALNEYLSANQQTAYNKAAAAQNNYDSFVQAENDEKSTTRSSYTNAELNAFLNSQDDEEFDVEKEEEEKKKDTPQQKPNTFPGMSNTKNTQYSFNAETDQYNNQNELFNTYNQDDQFKQVPQNTNDPSFYENDP